MRGGTGSLKQRPSYHKRTFPPHGGNHLVHRGLITPHKLSPVRHHSPKVILVLAGSKLRIEVLSPWSEELLSQEHIVDAAVPPIGDRTRGVGSALVELAL